MNNYNNSYSNFQPLKKKKRGSGTAVVTAVISILILAIVCFSCVWIYFEVIKGYETKIGEYESLLREYKESYGDTLNTLNSKLSSLENSADNNSLSDISAGDVYKTIEPTQMSSNSSSTGFDAATIASKTAPTVIGVKVYVPAQNINSFWQSRPREGSGSGIIISKDGYIVTNYHVVENAVIYDNAIMTVVFIDGEEYMAQYVGGDEINDLAVIKINADNLQYATLGSSDEAKVGDYVIAIGNPLGVINLYGSVTFGIISGVNRKIEAENVAEELLQTDAAINPGNSGGALINSKGEVIGINTVKIASAEYEGLGFAIAIDYAKPLINSLIEYGYIKGRPTLGIDGSEISRSMAAYYRVPRGILVSSIDKNSHAVGIIQVNDIITKVDGKDVYSVTEMYNIVKTHAVGDIITVTVWRNGRDINIDVKLAEKR